MGSLWRDGELVASSSLYAVIDNAMAQQQIIMQFLFREWQIAPAHRVESRLSGTRHLCPISARQVKVSESTVAKFGTHYDFKAPWSGIDFWF